MATYSNNTTIKVTTQNTLSVTPALGVLTAVLATAANQYYEVEFYLGVSAGSQFGIYINGVIIGGVSNGPGSGYNLGSNSGSVGVAGYYGNRILLGPSSTLQIRTLSGSVQWNHHAVMFINTP